ncbi:1-deoxy-D-xylulose 5-phosphate reductoisomerase [Anaerobacterium chartisolvens]|uniref:1-deoxy-D-xylulose 5-phosphate reductoisomerase n=1 Tax=Anaerobacterium chartisolvens TaxID=1297424 RepID=A0A369AQL0_9FIRM|nr:1-deoxy-D-xylulose-5-phosphate reductoisomerase [Anaerobacterium chartisolvens]RCX11395.1 1-deoxy-D-xylulose 5-phosphate reductoisomerase [Anaerobacterium chartisolvens]
MVKKISILGSTGSVGIQSLDVARNLALEVLGISGWSNIDLLESQIREFRPRVASVEGPELAKELEVRVRGIGTEIFYGTEGMRAVASVDEAQMVINSVVGIAGLIPTMEAIKNRKDVALANKETLVTAGGLVMSAAKDNNVRILPVDSEHCAIFQCLMGNSDKNIRKVILTASGGPFKGRSLEELKAVTVQQALRHPNWTMGKKITIDSATLMNKGLEVIEARWLFDLRPDQIEVIVHPQSIVHSMVEYIDGAVMAQLGSPDMRLPIQFALTYPGRAGNEFPRLDFSSLGALTFEKPDYEAFPCLEYAFRALDLGGTMPAVLNAANEVAVKAFLDERARFADIPEIIGMAMDKHTVNNNPCLGDIIEVDTWAREEAAAYLQR